ncbi:MAG: hypothetical protein ACF8XB_24325 [Planctomycetota bacterium JB042]
MQLTRDSHGRTTTALRRVPAAALLVAILAAPLAASDPPPITILDLALHAEQFELTADGAYVFFTVDEGQQGTLDRNGDGDALDLVVHSVDTATGIVTNLGLAVTSGLAVDGHRVAFHVPEAEQGIDANGDGDQYDVVPHVFDADLGTVSNLGIAGSFYRPMISGGWVLFEVLEAAQGLADLNGDGDVADSVLHFHDLATGVTTNLGLAARPSFGGPTTRMDGARATVVVGETEQGYTDLNGDGDVLDGVVFVLDLANGGLANLGLAVPWTQPAPVFGDTVVILVEEASQANTDLNGDGDRYDLVLHLHRPTTPPIVNLGLAAADPIRVSDTLVFSVSESSQGGLDFNGDGDGKDVVLFSHDILTGETHDLAVASTAPLVDSHWIAFAVFEWSQGQADLNGDGDAQDWVLHVHDVTTRVTTNLAAEGTPYTFERRRIGYLVYEYLVGADLNADGDISVGEQIPKVIHVIDGSVRNLGVAGVVGAGDDDRVVIRIDEQADGGVDRNGDGDANDDVLLVFESEFGTTIDVGLDGADVQAAGEWLAFSCSESANGGVDRNGDGDAQDRILHLAKIAPGVCGSTLPYGNGCSGPHPEAPELHMRGCVRPGHPVAVSLLRGSPFGKAFVAFGTQRGELPMGGGCDLLVSPPMPLLLGPIPLSGFGSTRTEAFLPLGTPPGLVRMQAFVLDGSAAPPTVTNGLEFDVQ